MKHTEYSVAVYGVPPSYFAEPDHGPEPDEPEMPDAIHDGVMYEMKASNPMSDRMIPLTDHRGAILLPEDELTEPNPGSVVLTEGMHGTAWQRFFSDKRWHPTRGGGSKTWEQLLSKRNLFLVYDAEVREPQGRAV